MTFSAPLYEKTRFIITIIAIYFLLLQAIGGIQKGKLYNLNKNEVISKIPLTLPSIYS